MTSASSTPDNVVVCTDRSALGQQAGEAIAATIQDLLSRQDRVRIVFAAAPSQAETLAVLAAAEGIDWSRVDAFHMDEYVGLAAGTPQLFGEWLRVHLFERVPFGSVHIISPTGDPERIAADYAQALGDAPVDIVCGGIGVNGHIAFNDPPVADFDDPLDVKVVELDATCRQQQVDDDCFDTFDDVPTHAITLTVPRLMRSQRAFFMVPGRAKAEAVRATFTEPVSTRWPSTILTTHPAWTLFLEPESASLLLPEP